MGKEVALKLDSSIVRSNAVSAEVNVLSSTLAVVASGAATTGSMTAALLVLTGQIEWIC